MASKNISDLIPEMRDKVDDIILDCAESGIDILIYCTYRSLIEQAKLFRQGRSYDEIKSKINKLTNSGYKILAEILNNVDPQYGKKVTFAGPGESWHNFREAFDAVPVIGGEALWNDVERYDIYGKIVLQNGLDWGGGWKRHIDKPHAQFRFGINPLKIYNPDQIQEIILKNNIT